MSADTLRERLEGLADSWDVPTGFHHTTEANSRHATQLRALLASAPTLAGDDLCKQGDHYDVDGKCTACGRIAPTLASSGVGEPWLYAIEEQSKDGRWSWRDGEQCVFGDRESAQDEVNALNEDDDSHNPYRVVPLYRAAAAWVPRCVYEQLLAQPDTLRERLEGLREFLTDLSKATTYKMHPLGYENCIDIHWKDDAQELLDKLDAAAPPAQAAPAQPDKEAKAE